MIVLDASFLIAYLDGDDPHHQAAEQLIMDSAGADLRVNPLTLAEVFVGPARHGRMEDAQSAVRDLDMAEVAFPSDTAARLARLHTGTGLKMPDCCVLLAATEVNGAVASFDARLVRAAAGLGLRVIE